ncbi:hypothetical protein NFI96_018468 [Prochilodus magdalenae]|nr:hypothetical protein NFI96_018468 [Prochilodus magdalenae]
MSVRFFILLLCLFMTLQKVWTDGELKVTTFLQDDLNDPGLVKVICQYDEVKAWAVEVGLGFKRTTNWETMKDVPRETLKKNQIMFTLRNSTSSHKNFYRCEFYKHDPLPVVKTVDKEFKLFPGCSCPANICESSEPVDVCPSPGFPSLSGPLTWALIGLVFLLCLYSLCVTAVYIKLRVKRSEEVYDTLTYVPMQIQVKPKEKVKRQDAEKNAEYMDMRKVHPEARPIRDMNYNSHHIPNGFTM